MVIVDIKLKNPVVEAILHEPSSLAANVSYLQPLGVICMNLLFVSEETLRKFPSFIQKLRTSTGKPWFGMKISQTLDEVFSILTYIYRKIIYSKINVNMPVAWIVWDMNNLWALLFNILSCQAANSDSWV